MQPLYASLQTVLNCSAFLVVKMAVPIDLKTQKGYYFHCTRRTRRIQMMNSDAIDVYLEYGGQRRYMYIDFEKAFDKVPHKRLISKLISYGFNSTFINWIQDFLKSRNFRVRVRPNSSFSLWDAVTSGIPQGSVLGPLLFLLYINDLVECCDPYCEIYLFADDAKLFRHIVNLDDNCSLQKGIWCFTVLESAVVIKT